jgi:dTDP-glucose pyrophosphorylase
MAYDAVILAGGESSSDLKKIAPYDSEALILIGKYPMIYYVYHALAGPEKTP